MNGSLEDELRRENEKLRKIARALTERVERSTDAQGTAFTLFQTAITLEETVRKRTAELLRLNEQLRREIEERIQAEDALRLATAAAERANAHKTTFLASASHDVLQPLNAARLFVEALTERAPDGETLAIARRADEALSTANNVLATLLDISKLDAGAVVPDVRSVPLEPLLRQIGNEYGLMAENKGLRFRAVPSALAVRTDGTLLERLLRNLVSNAVKYTARGGVLIGCRRRGETVEVEVWDTGPGIPSDRIDEAFEEFRRLSGDEAGVGLGLSIVKRIARLLCAEVVVRTRLGRGSVFSVALPLATSGHDDVAAAADVRAYADPLAGKTIAVVDDDGLSLEGLALVLRAWGCATVAATSVARVAEAVRAAPRAPDFIVADYHLGTGESGLDAIRAIRAACGGTPAAIVVTGDRSDEVRRAVGGAGAHLLHKPLRTAQLRSLLAHLAVS